MKKIKLLLCSILMIVSVLFQVTSVNAKEYSGNVTVKVGKMEETKNKIQLKMTVRNHTDKEVEMESCYVLQKKEDGKWKTVQYKKNASSSSMVYVIEEQKKKVLQINLSSMYPKKELKEGKFRLGVIIDNKTKFAKFVI